MGNTKGSELLSEDITDIEVFNKPKEKIYYVHHIKDEKAWKQISSQPKSDSNTFSDTYVAKVVWDIRKEEIKMYLVNTNLIEFHYDFVKKCLPKNSLNRISSLLELDLYDFNEHNYWENEQRKFVLGSLIHYKDIDKFCLELNAEDNIDSEKLLNLFSQLYDSVYFSKELYYKPCSNLTESIAKLVNDEKFKTLSIQEIFKGITYQCYNKASCYGYVKILTKENFDPSTIHSSDIVVTDFVPNDIPYCSGLITTIFQAPLCHVSILSQNRGSLNVYSKTAFDDLKKYFEKNIFVKITATSNGLKIEDFSNEKNKEKLLNQQKNAKIPKIILPEVSTKTNKYILSIEDWKVEWAGMKAHHLQVFSKDLKLLKNGHLLSEGVVIPFKLYIEHLTQLKLDYKTIQKKDLEKIQQEIMNKPIEEGIMKEIIQGFIDLGLNNTPLIMRSSTNAEDMIGFNGAGLYLSKPVFKIDEIENVLKEIFASVFSYKAFEEREFYRIDHSKVAMAVLVQPFLSDTVLSKGVAMTYSPIRTDFGSFMINAQPNGVEVTDSGGGIPEQIVCYLNCDNIVQEVISRSDLTKDNEPVLSIKDVQTLFKILRKIDRSEESSNWKKYGCCADVEFIVSSKNDEEIIVYIVQIRPFTVRL
eukprot:gene9598-1800_t